MSAPRYQSIGAEGLDSPFRVVGSRVLTKTDFVHVDRIHLAGPNGVAFHRVAVRHPGAVAVVPMLGDDVVLIRQFRAPIDQMILEIPAGRLDVAGEPPEAAAIRECAEEIGYRPSHVEPLAEFYTAPGLTDEREIVYLGTGLEPVDHTPMGVEEEHAEIVMIPFDDAMAMIHSREIIDVKTIVGLLAVAAGR